MPLPRWFSEKNEVRDDPVQMVQRALSETAGMALHSLNDALDAIVHENLWQDGRPFRTFGEFAVALPPAGLGVRSLRPLKVLRHALLSSGYFAQWTDTLELTAREPGRPRKKLVNDEGFERFYTVPTATTARDRLLLALKRKYPEHFADVCQLRRSPREAAITSGLIAAPSRRYGVCDFAAAKTLKEPAQAKLLRELFRALSLNAQCSLLALEVEPRLGLELPQRWRGSQT
jgi:hypothetical protein